MRAFKKLLIMATMLAFLSLAIVGCAYLPIKISVISDSSKPKYLYESIIFELAPTKGNEPDLAALLHFRSKLEEYGICRIECVFFIPKSSRVRPQTPWTLPLLFLYEIKNRDIHDHDPEDRVAVIFVPYISGLYLKAEGKLRRLGGIQYGPTSFAMFTTGSKNREAGVLLHEFGHLIGICKKNKKPRHHCPDRSCVMYKSTGSPYAGFCDVCQEELAGFIKRRNR